MKYAEEHMKEDVETTRTILLRVILEPLPSKIVTNAALKLPNAMDSS